jgi:hypothetical protein
MAVSHPFQVKLGYLRTSPSTNCGMAPENNTTTQHYSTIQGGAPSFKWLIIPLL